MIISKNFIFLRLEKTGSVFLKDFLLKHVPQTGERRRGIGQFGQSGHFGLIRKEELLTFSGIRNPYTWYPSFFNMVRNNDRVNAEYDLSSFENFMNDFANKSGKGLYFNYDFINEHEIGLLTHQFLKICCQQSQLPYDLNIDAPCVVDEFYHQESLVDDVISFLPLSEDIQAKLRAANPTNVTDYTTGKEDLTDEMRAFIRQRDSMIFEKFPEYD